TAQRGEDRAGKPLDGDAAAVDEAGGAAVDRQRRLVAEFESLGRPGSMGAAQPCMLQPAVPLRARSPVAAGSGLRIHEPAESPGTMPGTPIPCQSQGSGGPINARFWSARNRSSPRG